MWHTSDFEDGYESNKTGCMSEGSPPDWSPVPQSPCGPGNSICGGRRLSTVSDSGDTGIGTYCSDSVEDDSSSSTTPLSFQPLSRHPLSQNVLRSRSCQLLAAAMSPLNTSSCVDMKSRPQQPIRRCSSLTKLSSCGADRSSASKTSHVPGSLDRRVLYGYRKEALGSNVDLFLPLASSPLPCHNLLQPPSPSAGPAGCYQYKHGSRSTELSLSSAGSSPLKHTRLEMNCRALPEANVALGGGQQVNSSPQQAESAQGHHTDRGASPIHTAVRTQMWLTEQMEYRPKGTAPDSGLGGYTLSPWQQGHQQDPAGLNQMLMRSSLPVHTLVKVKEGLLRQREMEIERQKQQILQLHARIRENELRAQLVLQSQRGVVHTLNNKETAMRKPFKQPAEHRPCWDEELSRKLAVAELEVLYLNEFYKQVTQTYMEDIRKLEEKIKTRDRYISSLKRKCHRESEQNQEKQLRIETLEKYLSDLPTLDEAQATSQQEEGQQKAQDLENTMCGLQSSLEEGCALMEEKDFKIEMQAQREKELIASVHSLQKKVQHCLADGVRLPMQDLRRLEVENTELLKQKDNSSMMMDHQKQQIDRLTSQLTATSSRLQKKRGLSHQQLYRLLEKEESPATPLRAFPQCEVDGSMSVGRLLREMSMCVLDLRALCSSVGKKEPNLALLLAMKSLSVSAEESDCRPPVEQEVMSQLLEVSQLRTDIDELRRSISDCYAQYMGDSCVSQ